MRLVVFVTLLMGFASVAAAEGYLCTFKGRKGGFIPGLMAIDLRSDGTVLVIDDFIAALEKTPKVVKPRKTSNGGLEMSWNLQVPTTAGESRVRFRAVFNESTRKATMAARIRHATNHERGSASCEPRKFPTG